ncbi:HTH_Tnp_Tc3_2 domain-containing protein [Trichonephila clavipes]|nr:HTH_Tnp_Tc3_2 domain-containing protein [Trichonephila clavipes]
MAKACNIYIHWCAKIKDEVEKLAYQLNEEAERTERPIRRLSQKKGRQTAGEIARHTTQATGRPISRFTVARRLHGGGLFARRPVRCVPLTPAHRRRRSLWCREHRNWRDNEWGRVLFTDESRFSLSTILIAYSSGESGEAAIIPRTSLKGTASLPPPKVAAPGMGPAYPPLAPALITEATILTGPISGPHSSHSYDTNRGLWARDAYPDLKEISEFADFPKSFTSVTITTEVLGE